ncbi:hypothetical protein D3C74_442790 [compost metagenome]
MRPDFDLLEHAVPVLVLPDLLEAFAVTAVNFDCKAGDIGTQLPDLLPGVVHQFQHLLFESMLHLCNRSPLVQIHDAAEFG